MNSFSRARKYIWTLDEDFFSLLLLSNSWKYCNPSPLFSYLSNLQKASTANELIKTFFVASSESLIWNICITILLAFKEAQARSLVLVKLEFLKENVGVSTTEKLKNTSSHFVMSTARLFLASNVIPLRCQTKLDLGELLAWQIYVMLCFRCGTYLFCTSHWAV